MSNIDENAKIVFLTELLSKAKEEREFLFTVLEKAKTEREELMKEIQKLSESLAENNNLIEKLSYKTNVEEQSFRKILTRERIAFDSKLASLQQKLTDR